MKFQILSALVGALSVSVSASPLEKRAGTLVGYGAGTTGGAGGSTTVATSCSALKAAVSGTAKKIVRIESILTGCGILDVGSNTSIFGKGSNSGLKDGGFRVRKGTNVIFQNLKLGPAPKKGDVLAIDQSTKIWVDHVEFASLGLVGGKDDYVSVIISLEICKVLIVG
jgi:pectate lyase